MSHYMTALAMRQTGLKPAAKIVLYWLADHHNSEIGDCFPSLKKLAEECEMAKASVVRHLDALESAGLIERQTRTRDNGSQTSTAYILTFTPVSNCDSPCLKMRQPPVSNCDPHNLGSINLGKEPTPIPPKGADLFSEKELPESQDSTVETLFEEFWNLYPKNQRKANRKGCLEKFRSICSGRVKTIDRATPDQIVHGLRGYVDTNPDLKFVPAPLAWLNGAKWEAFQGPREANRYQKIAREWS